ncbi:MAG TPA: hypothetical protein VK781_05330 [Solirubrobacteraceae bacterium]|nr:hypothetical protein [Solirubrobacteraceae bacterium]
MLLAGLPSAASAAEPDPRGEWALTITSGAGTLHGKALITDEANVKGEFTAQSMVFENVIQGTFKGTLEGATASVETTSMEFGPVPAGKFTSNKEMTEEVNAGLLKLSGSGTLVLGGHPGPATLLATQIKTQRQIEEQEAQETREREEREARASVRGEWSLTLESGPTVLKGTALISEEANAKNEFSSSGALFEGFIPGTFSGTLEGSKATVTITTQAAGPAPAGTFTSATISVVSGAGSMSMSGIGTFKAGEAEFPSTLTATRIKSHQEILEREATELEAREKQEKEAQQAAEKAAREKQEKELKERQEREAREAAEKAAAILKAQITPITSSGPQSTALVSALLVGNTTLTPARSGSISFDLRNPNSLPVHGHLKLTLAQAGKGSSAKHTSTGGKGTLGEVSFSLLAKGAGVVKLKLSQSWRTQLAHHRTLHVLATLTTLAAGQSGGASKSYSLTLRAPSSAHHGKG